MTTKKKAKAIDGLSIADTKKQPQKTRKATVQKQKTNSHKTQKSQKSQKAAKTAVKAHIDDLDVAKEIERLEALETKEQNEPEDILAEIDELEQDAKEEGVKKHSKSKKATKAAKKSETYSKIIRSIIILAEAISAGILLFLISRVNVLATWQNIALGLVLLGLLALTSFKLIRKKTRKAPRILFGILSIILTIIYILGANYLNKTIGFLQNITTTLDYETQEYSVLVLKNSEFEEIDDLKDKTIGFQQNNPNLELAQKGLTETISYKAKEESDLANLLVDLEDNNVSGIVLASTYLETLKENQKEFYDSAKVIYTYEIKYPKSDDTTKANITKEPFIIYISGSDSRGKLSNADRSDVNMLAVVNPNTNKILLVSVPRDYYVQLHGTTGNKDKLTHAGIYGIDMSKNTIQDIFGVTINYTAKIGFTGVEKVVDALGGVDVNSDTRFTAWTDRSCHFEKGIQHVNGQCALAYARERYAYTTGDRHRVKNQQEVLGAIIKKATQPQYLIHYTDILASLESSFVTSLSYDEITSFAKLQLNTMKGWQIESISVDGTGAMLPTYSMGSQPLSVMIPNQETIDAAKAKINETISK